ncbi:NADPH-dependent FMN reductase [Mycoplasma leonicaptivi]|uniref:NADPH-dependent FMN reductase n=1 Tax=Mycoplasma leonicaptivi TaxID=36742 RepID=UPI000484A613|nr:NADPH-dependent FMN reductase [Mycoplasma leonicaptivi]
MKKILFVVGSLRDNSFNLQLAKKAQELISNKAEVSYLDYSKLQLMNQDLEKTELPEIKEIRKQVLESDLIWVFSPVYNSQMPGSIKNLLDWLSRSLDKTQPKSISAINDKKVTVSCVAAKWHEKVFEQYKDLLTFIRANVVCDFTDVQINPEAWSTGILTLSEESVQKLQKQVKQVLQNL